MTWKSRLSGLEKLSLIESQMKQIAVEIQRFQQPLPQDPVQWTQKTRILKGRAFSFDQREHLFPIYRDTHPRIIVVKARQLEMTEWLVNWILYKLTTYPFTTAIYTAPRMDQVSRFSQDRFRKAILDSPELRPVLTKREQELGEVAITRVPFINGSVCYLVSAWGDFGAIRNIPADFAAVDEMQDIQTEALPVIEESLSHSQYGQVAMVGTASVEGSEFCHLWRDSDMKEWDREASAWIPQRPEHRSYSGYHIDQRMGYWITSLPPEHPNSIEWKRHHYSDRRFMNEVLGQFYRGLAKPLIPEDLLACADRDLDIMLRLDPPYESYAGIDWGGGEFAFTVIWIMALDDQDRWQLVYCHKFSELDPMKQVERIANMITLFNVKQAVADIGYGSVQVSELQKRFGNRVMGCQYVRRPEMPLERREKDEDDRTVAQMIVQADRSFWIEKGIQIIKRLDPTGKVKPALVLPWNENASRELEWIIDHFCALEMEEQEMVSGKKYHHYTHPEGEPDDAYHGFIYALIAYALGKMTSRAIIRDLFD